LYLNELKYFEDTRPQNQQIKVEEQHAVLIDHLRRHGYKHVKLHVVLNGAMGTIYDKATEHLIERLDP
jgi:hypothetical protein